ncbi:hypothetical protein SPICUR_05215 [Spiribacter curvatus]|uniref:HTH lacI-type domain-containing protein n=1 Tax=Spiribacter curvatus TaxID=1335757 RepID=U5T395_9GAMM|nr:LacI family DNA-binding transcriptional regulator [Spiribacter curvatus]AGY92019.1 hypothetical protein SPICUR_05215 [Spiribacter curvatus]
METDDTQDAPNKGRRRSGRATITDVARHANVARITVSRAINDPGSVSPERRRRVDAAIAALGYVPNRHAGSLASSMSPVVPLIVPSLSNTVFLEVIRGAQSVLEAVGYELLLGNTDYDVEREQKLMQTLLGWSPAGAIVSGLRHSDGTLAMLRRWDGPCVEIMEYGTPNIDMNVGLSHEAAGATMARHLIARGYRRIGFVGTLLEWDYRAAQRLSGFQSALDQAGIELSFVERLEAPSTVGLGGKALKRIFSHHPDADATFFANDDLAVGAILEAPRLGIRVPDDMAVAGFNGLNLGNHVNPRLTTIVSPRLRMGRRAAEMLLAGIRGEPVPQRAQDIGFRLVPQEST